jgi:hypothetical protein
VYSANSQDFHFKSVRDIPVEHTWILNMADAAGPSAQLVADREEAPEPAMFINEIKNKRNASRIRRAKFAKNGDRIVSTPEDIKPTVKRNFNGRVLGGAGTPNDNNMAISNSGIIMSVINSSVSIYNSSGDQLQFRTLRSFVFGQLPNLNRTYDPKVVYDPNHDRFILVFLQGTSSADTRIITGFSLTADPTGDWKFYAIDGNPFDESTWSDYPIIGISENDLYITVNILEDGLGWQEGFTQSVIWQINLEDGYNGEDELGNQLYYDLTYKNKPIWSICAVKGSERPSGPGMYFLSVRPSAEANDTVFLHRITGDYDQNKADYTLQVLQSDKPYGVPPSAFQPDPEFLLQTNDTRVLDAFIHNNTIQYVQTSYVEASNSSGIYHGMIDLNTSQVRANYIFDDSLDYAYPSIVYSGVDRNTAYSSTITFSHSGEWDFPGTSVVHHHADRNLGSLYSPVVSVRQGEGLINTFLPDSIERWGDYTAIQRKYNEEGVVWLCGSYGEPDEEAGTWLAEIAIENDFVVIKESRIYPNPAADESRIGFVSGQTDKVSVEIFDLLGQRIYSSDPMSVEQGYYEVRLDLTGLESGKYIARVVDSNSEPITEHKLIIADR